MKCHSVSHKNSNATPVMENDRTRPTAGITVRSDSVTGAGTRPTESESSQSRKIKIYHER